jgi:NAD(P)-dependent dehydrogenase (short-subunit alcohol dehydrogenase family)
MFTWSTSPGLHNTGYQIATGFVAHGAKVYITSRDEKACDETAKELNAMGKGSCVAIPADLSKLAEVDRLVKEIKTKEDSELLCTYLCCRDVGYLRCSFRNTYTRQQRRRELGSSH